MSTHKTRLTTTSYALLGLLELRTWTTYELADQMGRSLGYIWPRAASVFYREAKNLVAHGYATARDRSTGRRAAAVYSITPAGRKALRRWLSLPSTEPRIESEALVRITFPELGTRAQILGTLSEMRGHAAGLQERIRAQAEAYLGVDGGPFPERLPVIALDVRFVTDFARFLEGWAAWASAQVEAWPGDRGASPEEAREQIRQAVSGATRPGT